MNRLAMVGVKDGEIVAGCWSSSMWLDAAKEYLSRGYTVEVRYFKISEAVFVSKAKI